MIATKAIDAPAAQAACNVPAKTVPTLPATVPHIPVAATSADEQLARQKALFVCEVWNLATANNIPRKDAAVLVGMRREQFPLLIAAGPRATKNLLLNDRAYSNFRRWSRELGTMEESRTPDIDNWRTLLPRYRGSRAYTRPGDPRFWVLLANIYEDPNALSMRYAYRLATIACRSEPDIIIPTYDQVRHYYECHADRKAVDIARRGEEWFRNNLADYINRRAPAIDEVWVGDHHIFDCAVRIQDPGTGNWIPVRPWLTAWLDWGSLYFVGWQIRTISPNRDSIERSLRAGIQSNAGHVPLILYVDNGKDYKAAGFTRPVKNTENDRVRSIAEALHSRVIFSEAYNARAKIIERTFGIVCGQFAKLWHSYRGSTPADRPARADHYWTHPELLPTLDEFATAFGRWLNEVYHIEPSTGKVLAGKSPQFARANITRLRPHMDELAIYKAFLRELPRQPIIQRGGVVRALNREYRSEELWRMYRQVDSVRVKVDPDDVNLVWIYTADGREIGPATCKPELPAAIDRSDPQTIEQLRAEKRHQRRQIRDAKRASIERRNLVSWRTRPQAPALTSGIAGTLSAPTRPRPAPDPRPAAEPCDPALVNELDAALNDHAADILAARQAEPIDAADLTMLEDFESETHQQKGTHHEHGMD
jgi:hypothetical protein